MRRSRQQSITRGTCGTLAALAVLCAVTARVEGSAQDAPAGAGTALRTIRVVTEASGGATTVVLEADGPLPEPTTGAVDGPPRIYLDLKDVRPGSVVRLGESDALVRRTRVALHSENPVSSRVVIDLYKPSPYRVDSSGRAEGRLIIVLGASSSTPAAAPSSSVPGPVRTTPPAPAAPSSSAPDPVRTTPPALAAPSSSAPGPARTTPPAPATPSTSGPESPSAPNRRASGPDAYVAQVSVVLGRLQALRPVLVSIDRRAEQPAGDLTAAAAEFDAVARILAAIRVPASRETTQALLVRASALGARASRMRLDSTQTEDVSGWNAASAAAGALLMLDRASIDIIYSAPK